MNENMTVKDYLKQEISWIHQKITWKKEELKNVKLADLDMGLYQDIADLQIILSHLMEMYTRDFGYEV